MYQKRRLVLILRLCACVGRRCLRVANCLPGSMSMTCTRAGCVRWCYGCGLRDDACPGCRAGSPYIHRNDGWGHFAKAPGQNAGYGALYEFHRRRMAVALRGVATDLAREDGGCFLIACKHRPRPQAKMAPVWAA